MRPKALFALLACVSCGPRSAPEQPRPPEDLARLVTLEAAREQGTEAAAALAASDDREVRVRAVRALGRIGDAAAIRALRGLTANPDDATRDAAIWALGVAGGDGSEQHLIETYAQAPTAASRAAVVEALGRVGGPDSLTVLTASLGDGDPAVRAAGAIAIGVLGRRQIAIDDGVRRALAASVGHTDREVRYGIAYAFAREHEPPADPAAEKSLVKLARDADPEIRATALLGLVARKPEGAAVFRRALNDTSWLVRLQAVRGLALDHYGPDERNLLATQLAREWADVAGRPGRAAHVLAEGLRALAPYAGEEMVVRMVDTVAERAAARIATGELRGGRLLVIGMVHCLASALQVRRGMSLERVLQCGGKSREGWPRHARRKLAAELLGDGFGGDDRAAYWTRLVSDRDPRVRAAALEIAPAMLEADDGLGVQIATALRAGIADPEIEVAGTAADVIAKLHGSPSIPDRGLAAALVERARAGAGDIELELTFLAAIRDGKIAAGLPLCQQAVHRPNRTVRAIAAECARALGGAVADTAPSGPAPPPPVDPTPLLGKKVTWHLETTRGPVVIRLDPDRAPWHVAVLVRLTRKKFYDGLMWHRVVPGFVVQGGAPGDSAWGGPGFVIPAEMSPARFDAGTVGIADAGLDTGGSQIFIMHARAPHLESRYTVVGNLASSIEVVDALQVGDRIVSARVDVE